MPDAEQLESIRARIRRSLDGPRPNMSLKEVDTFLNEFFAAAEKLDEDEAS